jgi:hypothetical protein
MSSKNYFDDGSDDSTNKPVDRIVFRPTPIDAPELPKAKRVFDPAPRPKPQPLDVPNSKEWIPGEKSQKSKKKQPDGESRQHLLNAVSVFGKTLSTLIILGVLSGIGYFVYWIISQYKL